VTSVAQYPVRDRFPDIEITARGLSKLLAMQDPNERVDVLLRAVRLTSPGERPVIHFGCSTPALPILANTSAAHARLAVATIEATAHRGRPNACPTGDLILGPPSRALFVAGALSRAGSSTAMTSLDHLVGWRED
jgi:hypothetical protein